MMHSRWASFGPGQVGLAIHPYPTPKDGSTPILFWTTVTWYGIVAPVGTPVLVLDWLNLEIATILQQPAINQGLAADATEVVVATRQVFARHLVSEAIKWRDIIKNAGITNQQ